MRDFIEKIDNDNGEAGVVVADEYNSVFSELKNAVSVFFDLSESDDKQLVKSINAFSKAIHYTDTGTPNNILLSRAVVSDDIDTLFDGICFMFTPSNTNTSSVTIKVAQTPTRLAVDADGNEFTGGELVENELYIAIYAGDRFFVRRVSIRQSDIRISDSAVLAEPKVQGGKKRTQQQINKDFINGNDFFDSSITDYSGVFNEIAELEKGMVVDLKNKTYPVASMPKDIQLINGAIQIDGVTHPLPLEPKAHPLQGTMGTLLDDGVTHFWGHELIHDKTSGLTYFFAKQAYSHADNYDCPVTMYISDDYLLTLKHASAVFYRKDHAVVEVRGTMTASGRFVLLVAHKNLENHYKVSSMYSDDKGKNWIYTYDAFVNHFPYSDIMPHPTDANTYVSYGYISGKLQLAKTVNNGVSWTNTTIDLGVNVNEPTVAKLPNENKWIMLIRTNSSVMAISTSTDMLTWTQASLTPINLGDNPVQAYIENGRLYAYLFVRDWSETEATQNNVLLLVDDYDYVFDNKSFSHRNLIPVFKGADRMLGYMRVQKTNLGNIFTMNAGEGIRYASSSKILAGGNYLHSIPTKVENASNLLRNGRFDLWTRGDTFTTSGEFAAKPIADGWAFDPSGSAATISRVTVPVALSRGLPFKPKYGLKINAAEDDYVGISQKNYDPLSITDTQGQNILVQIWGIGNPPSDLRAALMYYSGTSDSETVTSTYETMYIPPSTDSDRVWYGTAYIGSPLFAEGVSITDGAYSRLILSNFAVKSAWDCTILGVHMCRASNLKSFSVVSHDTVLDKIHCQQYLRKYTYVGTHDITMGFAVSSTQLSNHFVYDSMAKTPTITVTGDLEHYPSATALTVGAVTNRTPRSAMLNYTGTGFTVGSAGSIRPASGGTVTILLDAEQPFN